MSKRRKGIGQAILDGLGLRKLRSIRQLARRFRGAVLDQAIRRALGLSSLAEALDFRRTFRETERAIKLRPTLTPGERPFIRDYVVQRGVHSIRNPDARFWHELVVWIPFQTPHGDVYEARTVTIWSSTPLSEDELEEQLFISLEAHYRHYQVPDEVQYTITSTGRNR